MPYSTAGNQFGRMLEYLRISGVHALVAQHSTRRQLATEALDDDPRELANVSADTWAWLDGDDAAVLHPRLRQR
jgi:hypothetical protein